MENRNSLLCLALMAVVTVATALPAAAQGPVTENPAVESILRADFRTPAEWVRAARALANLGRPDLGRDYLRRVLDAGLGQQQLVELAERFGRDTLLGMASSEAMLPEAELLADAVLTAADRSLRDPARIARHIEQLQDPSPDVRYQAAMHLVETRGAAVGPLVAVLADAQRADEQGAVRAVLARMGSDAVGPMTGLLEAPDPRLVAQAIQVLAEIGRRETAIYLLGPYGSAASDPAVRAVAGAALERLTGRRPGRGEPLRLLSEQAAACFDRRQPMDEDLAGLVELWRWDEQSGQCLSKRYPVEVASCVTAARLARDALALGEDDPQLRMLYLATTLEAAAYEAGLDRPLPVGEGTARAEVAAYGTEVVEDLLEYAIAGGHVPAATAAAEILGEIGSADELLRQGTDVAPLVRATRHADRRLRMAATEAVIRLQPVQPFPGSSYIVPSLAFFAGTSGDRRALVAGPKTEVSRELVGMLNGAGLRVDTAVTGRDLLRQAVASPDYELVLIDASIDGPPIEQLVQRLRHDCRTATLRVGLIARGGYLERAERVAARDPLALAFSQTHSDRVFARQIERLTALQPLAFVDHAERQRQAVAAMGHLVAMSRPGGGPFDVGRAEDAVLAALYTPGLGTAAAEILGSLGTAQCQQTLVDLASRWSQPVEVRMAAATAFRRSTQARGILLSKEQILLQYDRYNQSEDLDRTTRQILGLILDYIEAPTQAVRIENEAAENDGDNEQGA